MQRKEDAGLICCRAQGGVTSLSCLYKSTNLVSMIHNCFGFLCGLGKMANKGTVSSEVADTTCHICLEQYKIQTAALWTLFLSPMSSQD